MVLLKRWKPGYTSVSNCFIDYYISEAPGEFVKVYLCLLRMMEESEFDVTICALADFLDNSEKDVVRAFKYWEKKGVLALEYRDEEICGVELLELAPKKTLPFAMAAATEGARKTPEEPEPREEAEEPEGSPEKEGKAPLHVTVRENEGGQETEKESEKQRMAEVLYGEPKVAPKNSHNTDCKDGVRSAKEASETDVASIRGKADDSQENKPSSVEKGNKLREAVARYEVAPEREAQSGERELLPPEYYDNDYRCLLTAAEQYLGKPLTIDVMKWFHELHDQDDFSYDLIEYLLEYCVEQKKTNLNYMKKVAIDWRDKGLRTAKDAKDHVRAFRRENRAVMKAFGISDRILGRKELDYVENWIDKQHFSLELVVEACDRTLTAIQSPSFQYADKILMAWKEAGALTVEEARKVSDAHRQAAARKHATGRGQDGGARLNRFHNFDQRNIDYNNLLSGELGLRKQKPATQGANQGESADHGSDESTS